MFQRTIDREQMNITIVLGDKIPSIKYGGTQRVMWYLGKELNKRGHKVTFIAGKGSSCPFAKVIELDPSVNLNTQIPTDADIVHFNIPVPEGITKPHLLTIHGNGIPANADRNIVFVSRNHAQRLGSESFVYNGLDWDDYGPANLTLSRKNYHFLGKAAWKVKNIKGAIAVVQSIKNAQLDVLGGYRLNLKMGFRFTWNPRIHFHGMVDDSKKKLLLSSQKGLFPRYMARTFRTCNHRILILRSSRIRYSLRCASRTRFTGSRFSDRSRTGNGRTYTVSTIFSESLPRICQRSIQFKCHGRSLFKEI